ncbi:MAG: hypothetical protein M1827_006964 [Pycnora praestabilis]|nr:MAG: hypothetical protein M1827_006964 [Pycnora praestabilis]
MFSTYLPLVCCGVQLLHFCVGDTTSGVGQRIPAQQILGQQINTVQSVRDALKESEIIPDVIDEFKPSIFIQLSFPTNHQSVSLGNTLNPADVQEIPTFEFQSSGASSSGSLYTLVLTDPDAPSRVNPEWSEICHWILTNVSLTAMTNLHMDLLDEESRDEHFEARGMKEVIEFMPPSPPPKTGKHRYVFLLFRSADGGSVGNLTVPEDRKHWGTGKARHGVRQWAGENDLVPIGANFFYSQNDKQ